jgi:hypothetical protein
MRHVLLAKAHNGQWLRYRNDPHELLPSEARLGWYDVVLLGCNSVIIVR